MKAALGELRVKQLRAQTSEDAGKYEPDLAAALLSLAINLANAGGRTAEALDAAQESVTICRQLAAANPAVYEPDLARTLHNLAINLANAGGRTAKALDAA